MDWRNRIDSWERRKMNRTTSSKPRNSYSERVRLREQKLEAILKLECCVCGLHPEGFRTYFDPTDNGEGSMWIHETPEYEDWDCPDNLRKCTICGHWACANHLYKNVCRNCAEKMPE